jgi:hypothetical protein
VSIDRVSVEGETRTADTTVETEAELNHLLDLIDAQLPIELRADYLRLLAGEAVPEPRRERVQSAVQDILDPRATTTPRGPVPYSMSPTTRTRTSQKNRSPP